MFKEIDKKFENLCKEQENNKNDSLFFERKENQITKVKTVIGKC